MNQKVIKQRRIEHLLKVMKTEAMTVHQMAEEIGISSRLACDYLLSMKYNKLVHIDRYERRKGSPSVYYKTGNMPDAPKLRKITMAEYNQRYRDKTRLVDTGPFIPRMDIAASWMRNPL